MPQHKKRSEKKLVTTDQPSGKKIKMERHVSSSSSESEMDDFIQPAQKSSKSLERKEMKNQKKTTDRSNEEIEKEIKATKFCTAKDGSQLVLFKTGFSMLSNFYPLATFKIDGEEYLNVEQWVQANKAEWFGDEDQRERIMTTKSPREAKALGRKIDESGNDNLWVKEIRKITKQGIREKVNQNDEVKKLLCSTGKATIAEASEFNKFWSTGVDIDDKKVLNPKKWIGKNTMGKVLMEIRDEE